MGLFKSKPKKKKSGAGGIALLILLGYMFYKDPSMLHNLVNSFNRPSGSSSSQIVTTSSSFQQCVISRESSGDSQVWNKQGYPYWGLYQFGKPLWTSNGGSASSWGNAGSDEQTRVFNNVMSHYKGCENWTPSDGCSDPSNGC